MIGTLNAGGGLLAFEYVDHIFGSFIDFDRFIDIVAEIVCGFDFPFGDFFDHCGELFVGVATQDEAIIDSHGSGWFMDIEAEVEAFDTGFCIFIAGPHGGIDLEVSTACDPLFFVCGGSDEGGEVKPEGVDSAWSDCGSHGAKVSEGSFFGE